MLSAERQPRWEWLEGYSLRAPPCIFSQKGYILLTRWNYFGKIVLDFAAFVDYSAGYPTGETIVDPSRVVVWITFFSHIWDDICLFREYETIISTSSFSHMNMAPSSESSEGSESVTWRESSTVMILTNFRCFDADWRLLGRILRSFRRYQRGLVIRLVSPSTLALHRIPIMLALGFSSRYALSRGRVEGKRTSIKLVMNLLSMRCDPAQA